jgi:hypothetical protein
LLVVLLLTPALPSSPPPPPPQAHNTALKLTSRAIRGNDPDSRYMTSFRFNVLTRLNRDLYGGKMDEKNAERVFANVLNNYKLEYF